MNDEAHPFKKADTSLSHKKNELKKKFESNGSIRSLEEFEYYAQAWFNFGVEFAKWQNGEKKSDQISLFEEART